MESTPGSFDESRTGDEPADAQIGAFKVFGGAPTDRADLQGMHPGMIDEFDVELRKMLEHYGDTQ